MEKVQRRLISLIPGLKGKSYEEKLAEVGLDTLGHRRQRFDMITVYKLIHGYINMPHTTWLSLYKNHNHSRTLTAHLLLLPWQWRSSIPAAGTLLQVVLLLPRCLPLVHFYGLYSWVGTSCPYNMEHGKHGICFDANDGILLKVPLCLSTS